MFITYLRTFLYCVTTLVGAGILGLPVSIYKISPILFYCLLGLALIGQVLLIVLSVELFHKVNNIIEENPSENDEDVNLESMARRFLKPWQNNVFKASNLFLFLSILVIYGLGGVQAMYDCIVHSSEKATSPFSFTAVYYMIALLILYFFRKQVKENLLTVLPLIECSALTISILLVLWGLPEDTRRYSFSGNTRLSSSPFSASINPFLMCFATLGGLPGTMPFAYKEMMRGVSRTRQREKYFLYCLISALVFASLLNLGWVFAVYEVVPRYSAPQSPSLDSSSVSGEISTIPLLQIIKDHSAETSKFLIIIEAVLTAYSLSSTTASFLVISIALMDYIQGLVVGRNVLWLRFLSLVCFGSGFCLIIFFPNAFDYIIEDYLTPISGVQALIIVFMFWKAEIVPRENSISPEESSLLGRRSENNEASSSLLNLPAWLYYAIMIISATIFLGTIFLGFSKALHRVAGSIN